MLHLSDPIDWSNRDRAPNCPGVYVISNGEIIYIGKTWGTGGLRNRLRAFHRSATTGLKGHAGGVTYHKTFGPEVGDLSVQVHAPIAINPPPPSSSHTSAMPSAG